MSEEDLDIGGVLRAARASLKYERLAKDLETVKAETKSQRLELKKQKEDMRKIWDVTMVVMETTRAIQIVMQLQAMEMAAYPVTAAIGIFMLGAIAGLDIYYANKLAQAF